MYLARTAERERIIQETLQAIRDELAEYSKDIEITCQKCECAIDHHVSFSDLNEDLVKDDACIKILDQLIDRIVASEKCSG